MCRCKWPLVENDFWQVGQRCRRCVVVERGMSGGSGTVGMARGVGSDLSSGTARGFIWGM